MGPLGMRRVGRPCLALLLILGAGTGSLRGEDRQVLVPEMEFVRTADGEKVTRLSLSVTGAQRQPSGANSTEQETSTAGRRQARRRLAEDCMRNIVVVRPTSMTERTLDFALDGNGACESAARPYQLAESQSETRLMSYYFQANDERGARSEESETDNSSLPAKRYSPVPLSSLGVDIELPNGAPLPPRAKDPGDHRFDPLCACVDCPRPWGGVNYCFCATGLYYNPLYFEEINLERYGYGCHDCLQPFCSAAHFFGRVPLLPCMMLRECPTACNYALGHYRPGSCNPWRPVGCCRL